jgi:hypothetical protein
MAPLVWTQTLTRQDVVKSKYGPENCTSSSHGGYNPWLLRLWPRYAWVVRKSRCRGSVNRRLCSMRVASRPWKLGCDCEVGESAHLSRHNGRSCFITASPGPVLNHRSLRTRRHNDQFHPLFPPCHPHHRHLPHPRCRHSRPLSYQPSSPAVHLPAPP